MKVLFLLNSLFVVKRGLLLAEWTLSAGYRGRMNGGGELHGLSLSF